MKYNNISLPYPVLGINDDVYPLLSNDCIVMDTPLKTTSEYVFGLTLSQENEEIASLIAKGKAEYACEVSCKNTFLRKVFHSSNNHFQIRLSRKEVNGHINFNSFISVKEPIQGYSSPDFNEDYSGFTFDLDKGDLLAVFPAASYNTNINFEKLFAAGSFMQIIEAAEGVEKPWFNIDDDKIFIEMPHNMYEQYKRIGNGFPELIHSSLVHNALVYALSNLEEYQDKGKLWADCLVQRFNDPELQAYSIEDMKDMKCVFEVADFLLQDPYQRLLDAVERINDNLKEDE